MLCYSLTVVQYFQKWIRVRGGGGERREGRVAGRLCSVAGLVKLIDEKGKPVFLAGWGFILLAVLIHLSRFKVAAGGVAIALQGC